MTFDPALTFKLAGLQLQRGDCPGKVTGLVAQVDVRDLAVQLARSQLVHRNAHAVKRYAD
ncbi:hypothetical protein D3C81_1017340 [compost metagenome]